MDTQQQPAGTEANMTLRHQSEKANYKAAGKFEGKIVLITGAKSGIEKARAIKRVSDG